MVNLFLNKLPLSATRYHTAMESLTQFQPIMCLGIKVRCRPPSLPKCCPMLLYRPSTVSLRINPYLCKHPSLAHTLSHALLILTGANLYQYPPPTIPITAKYNLPLPSQPLHTQHNKAGNVVILLIRSTNGTSTPALLLRPHMDPYPAPPQGPA